MAPVAHFSPTGPLAERFGAPDRSLGTLQAEDDRNDVGVPSYPWPLDTGPSPLIY